MKNLKNDMRAIFMSEGTLLSQTMGMELRVFHEKKETIALEPCVFVRVSIYIAKYEHESLSFFLKNQKK